MNQETWTAVEQYFVGNLVPHDDALTAALRASEAAGLPAIAVAPSEGKLLHLLAKIQGAKTILEIGTLGGYSTIWMAQALPDDGKLISLEFEPKHADVARANIEQAGLSGKVEVRVGAALDLLPDVQGPFDLVFIDADKQNNPGYFTWALKLSRPGSLILIDNVVRGGAVIDAATESADVQGVRTVLEMIGKEPRVSATAIQTVGGKGYDGLAIVRVNS